MKILAFLTNKITLGVVLIVLAGAGVWWIVEQNSPRELHASPSSDSLSVANNAATLSALTERDRDNDGLPDWEEELWGTDPDSPDSDGDGTPDGEETASDRNPTNAGADDTLPRGSAATVEASIDAYLADESRTETEKIALKFFRGYAELRQTSGIGTSAEADLVNELINTQIDAAPRSRYISADLTVVADSAETRGAYKAALEEIVDSFSAIKEHELVTFERALQSGRENDIAGLDTATHVYTAALRTLLAMPVPRGNASAHLKLVNNFVLVIEGLGNMRKALGDPIRGMTGLQWFNSGLEGVAASLQEMHAYLERNDTETP